MELSFSAYQIIVAIINALSIAACIWMFIIFSKVKEKSVTFLTVIILLVSNLVFHITKISLVWAGDSTGTLEISNDLALYSSLFWSVAMSYFVFKAGQFAHLPTQDSYPYFNWIIFGCFMSACVWTTIKVFGKLGSLPISLVVGAIVAAVCVLYIMAFVKAKKGITFGVKSEIKIWGGSFLCAAIFLGVGTMIGALVIKSLNMWLILLASGITGISSVFIAGVYKFSVETKLSGSSTSSSSRSAFSGRGYTLM